MSNIGNQKIYLFYLILSIIIIFMLYIAMISEQYTFGAHDKKLVYGFTNILWLFICGYFILNILNKKRSSYLVEASKIPQGFKRYISDEKNFSFYYPQNWHLSRPQNPILAIQAKEPYVKKTDFLKNFNIAYQQIKGKIDCDLLLDKVKEGVLSSLANASLESKTPFQVRNLRGFVCKINYKNSNGLELCCYQAPMITADQRKMVVVTFTAKANDFVQSKPLFDEIMNLIEVSG